MKLRATPRTLNVHLRCVDQILALVDAFLRIKQDVKIRPATWTFEDTGDSKRIVRFLTHPLHTAPTTSERTLNAPSAQIPTR